MSNAKVMTTPLSIDQKMPHVPYDVDDTERVMAMWKRRLSVYFPDEVKHVAEYKMRYVKRGSHIVPKALLLLMNDDTLKEFTINQQGVGIIKKVTS